MQFLILGANGYLGSYLYKRMLSERINVIGTGHRHGYTKGLVKFDVLRDSIQNITKWVNDRERTAIICIAQTDIDQCKTQYEQSYQINVVFTQKMVEALLQESFHIIIFSTDNVFDGLKGHYTEFDKTNAVNQYGRMKAEMESFLSRGYPNVCIFRLPKVLGTEREQQKLLTDLEGKLVGGGIRCIKNSRMSIVAKEDVYQSCIIAARQKLCGIFNLSSGEIFSRKELAEKFFGHMGSFEKEIVELELEEFAFKDIRPLNISLDNTKFRSCVGYEFEPFDTIVMKYISNRVDS